MARCPIVVPDAVRVTLSDGEWVEFKRELNAGEYRDMLIAQFKDSDGETPKLDLNMVGMNIVRAYVVAWSFVGLDGKSLPVTPDVFRMLDHATFIEIRELAKQHHEAWERSLEARKNDRDGEKK